jgi:hypothetical protein
METKQTDGRPPAAADPAPGRRLRWWYRLAMLLPVGFRARRRAEGGRWELRGPFCFIPSDLRWCRADEPRGSRERCVMESEEWA